MYLSKIKPKTGTYSRVDTDGSTAVRLYDESQEDIWAQLGKEREEKEGYYSELIELKDKYKDEKKAKDDAMSSLSYMESRLKAAEKAKDEALSRWVMSRENRFRGYKTFFMLSSTEQLSSTEHEIYHVYIC